MGKRVHERLHMFTIHAKYSQCEKGLVFFVEESHDSLFESIPLCGKEEWNKIIPSHAAMLPDVLLCVKKEVS